MLLSGICPDLTPKNREVKQRLSKCHPRAYSDLIRLDIPGSSDVSPSCSPHARSPPLPAMEISPWGPLVVKLTQGELQARVESLAKKRRSVKRNAQDPPESSLPARGKIPKLRVSVSRSPVKERGSHASSGEGAGIALFSRGVCGGGCAASFILCCRSQGSFERGCRASIESSSYLCLEPFGAKHHAFPSETER